MKRLLYFLREGNYVTVRKNDVNKAFMPLYEKYSSFIFLSYFNPHHPFQWVKYSSNQKIIWSSATRGNTNSFLSETEMYTCVSDCLSFGKFAVSDHGEYDEELFQYCF